MVADFLQNISMLFGINIMKDITDDEDQEESLPTKIYVEAVRQDLRRLQYWFMGFEAAGGKVPPCVNGFRDPIRASIILIQDHVQTKDLK